MKLKKCVLSFTLVLALLFSSIVPGFALEMDENAVVTPASVLEIINNYSTNPDTVYTVVAQKQLQGFGNETYTYYKLSPDGYAILLDSTNSLMEACYDADLYPACGEYTNSALYYGGPDVLCTLTNGQFTDVVSNHIYTADEISGIQEKQLEVETAAVENAELSSSSGSVASPTVVTPPIEFEEDRFASVEYSYFRNMYNYGYNTSATCVVIAASILLGYYDNYVSESYVATSYEQGNGTSEAFHQYLCGYVYGVSTPGGIALGNAAVGLNHYLADRQLAKKFVTYSGSGIYADMIDLIEYGVPFVGCISMSNGADTNHAVVVYAVSYNTGEAASNAVFTCHMGWDHEAPADPTEVPTSARLISATWFYNYAIIEDSTDTHAYTSWSYYNGTYHRRQCTSCGYYRYVEHIVTQWEDLNDAYHSGSCRTCNHTFTQTHESCWDDDLDVCTACGHSGSYTSTITNSTSPVIYMVCLY